MLVAFDVGGIVGVGIYSAAAGDCCCVVFRCFGVGADGASIVQQSVGDTGKDLLGLGQNGCTFSAQKCPHNSFLPRTFPGSGDWGSNSQIYMSTILVRTGPIKLIVVSRGRWCWY